MMTFKHDDKVVIKHQREMGVCTVVGVEATDMTILVGEDNKGNKIHKAVGYYVLLDTPNTKSAGYHLDNVELADD